MQYLTIFLAALAASGAMALPQSNINADRSVEVILRGDEVKDKSIHFRREPRNDPVSSSSIAQGPYTEVELVLGDDVRNEDLRCQILDNDDEPIVVLRGANTDVTFSDGGNGPWKFRTPSLVGRVTCDQDFAKIEPTDPRLQVEVLLQDQSTETGIRYTLSGVVENSVEVKEKANFETVVLDITGDLVDPALRCKLLGAGSQAEVSIPEAREIIVTRGDSGTKTTFADGDVDPPEWTLQPAQQVSQIVCSPEFQKAQTDDSEPE